MVLTFNRRKKIQAEKIKEKIIRYKEEKQKSLGSYGIGMKLINIRC